VLARAPPRFLTSLSLRLLSGVQEAVYRCLIRATDGKKKVTTTVRLAPLLLCRASAGRPSLTLHACRSLGRSTCASRTPSAQY
jgi:hypothetical protein